MCSCIPKSSGLCKVHCILFFAQSNHKTFVGHLYASLSLDFFTLIKLLVSSSTHICRLATGYCEVLLIAENVRISFHLWTPAQGHDNTCSPNSTHILSLGEDLVERSCGQGVPVHFCLTQLSGALYQTANPSHMCYFRRRVAVWASGLCLRGSKLVKYVSKPRRHK